MSGSIQSSSVEIHLPISPNAYYFNLVRYFTLSLRLNGGTCANARVVVTAGDGLIDQNLKEKYPWLEDLGVEVRWVDPVDFSEDSYFATGYQRWENEYSSDLVVMMDADMLVAGDFSGALDSARAAEGVAGVVAHASPFRYAKYWRDPLLKTFALEDTPFDCEYTAWEPGSVPEELRYCPPYFNFGFVAMPTHIAGRIGGEFRNIFKKIKTLFRSSFWGQMALTVAILKLRIPYRLLDMRFNFANVPLIESRYRALLPDARVLHLLFPGELNRDEIFGSEDGVERFLSRADLSGVAARAQRVLKQVHPFVVRS